MSTEVTPIPSWRWYARAPEPVPVEPQPSAPDPLPRAPWRPQHPVRVVARFETRTKHGGHGRWFTGPERRRW